MSGFSGASGSSGLSGFSGYSDISDSTVFYTGANILEGYSSILNHTVDGVNYYDGSGTSGFGSVNTSKEKPKKYTLSSIK